MKKAYLLLENGMVFEGVRAGADKNGYGEAVFHTAVAEYMSVLSSPCYAGKLVVMTYPVIGAYGVDLDAVSSPNAWLSGLIVRELCDTPSNRTSMQTVREYLLRNNIPCIEGIDTRRLTQVLRDQGSMRAMIYTGSDFKKEECMSSLMSAEAVKLTEVFGEAEYSNVRGALNIAVISLGEHKGIFDMLKRKDIAAKAIPGNEKCNFDKVDGIIVSGGPEDLADDKDIRQNIKEAIDTGIPLLAVGTGARVIAGDGKFSRLPFGHRGVNQPVTDLTTGRTHITRQNHEYVLTELPEGAEETYRNLNDGTIEGFRLPDGAEGIFFMPDDDGRKWGTEFIYESFINERIGKSR